MLEYRLLSFPKQTEDQVFYARVSIQQHLVFRYSIQKIFIRRCFRDYIDRELQRILHGQPETGKLKKRLDFPFGNFQIDITLIGG